MLERDDLVGGTRRLGAAAGACAPAWGALLALAVVLLVGGDATAAAQPGALAPDSGLGRALAVLTDPNVAYVLLALGIVGLLAELYSPGLIFPGVVGAVALALAFVALSRLPTSWTGVVLLTVAVGLLIAELYIEGTGLLGAAGLLAFVLGSVLLFGPAPAGAAAGRTTAVSPWLIVAVTVAMALLLFVVARAVMAARRQKVATGVEALVGRVGIALTRLEPRGTVRIGGEVWTAEADDGPVFAGEPVVVASVAGVTLRVRRARGEVGPTAGPYRTEAT